jgi:hypothetical protein
MCDSCTIRYCSTMKRGHAIVVATSERQLVRWRLTWSRTRRHRGPRGPLLLPRCGGGSAPQPASVQNRTTGASPPRNADPTRDQLAWGCVRVRWRRGSDEQRDWRVALHQWDRRSRSGWGSWVPVDDTPVSVSPPSRTTTMMAELGGRQASVFFYVHRGRGRDEPVGRWWW